MARGVDRVGAAQLLVQLLLLLLLMLLLLLLLLLLWLLRLLWLLLARLGFARTASAATGNLIRSSTVAFRGCLPSFFYWVFRSHRRGGAGCAEASAALHVDGTAKEVEVLHVGTHLRTNREFGVEIWDVVLGKKNKKKEHHSRAESAVQPG